MKCAYWMEFYTVEETSFCIGKNVFVLPMMIMICIDRNGIRLTNIVCAFFCERQTILQ